MEAEGFDTLLVADHYTNPLSCGPLLAAAASVTTRLRLGSYVYNNDFRHPALLAKEAATIDVLSGGRLELGVGAGWHKGEYDWVGLPFDPPRVRAGRFEESVALMTRLFTGEEVHFNGEYYHLDGLPGAPLPIQQPLPLLIGGGGPRMIRFAGQRASIVGFVPGSLPGGGLDPLQFSFDSMERKIGLLDAAVAGAGRTDGGPERSILVFGLYRSLDEVTENDGIPRHLVPASPYALVGDVEAIVATLHERRERWGLSYYVCFDGHLEQFLPIVRHFAA